jgi:hypothetical protein
MANRSFESGCILRLRDSACPGSSGFTFSTAQGKPPVALVNSESTDQLSQNLRGDFASHVCQSKIAAGIVERQAFVVHSQQVQDRRV